MRIDIEGNMKTLEQDIVDTWKSHGLDVVEEKYMEDTWTIKAKRGVNSTKNESMGKERIYEWVDRAEMWLKAEQYWKTENILRGLKKKIKEDTNDRIYEPFREDVRVKLQEWHTLLDTPKNNAGIVRDEIKNCLDNNEKITGIRIQEKDEGDKNDI